MQNKMDLNDLLEQFQQVKKMGPIKGILSKLPGVGNKLDDVDIDDRIMGPQRGHHPLHDALRALPPGLPQRLPEEGASPPGAA